ncbi:DUF72 domain-containing protein [Tenggerimyces flavus]|uniref:DUF72 domain-containing protein n=1 Tax=Tenggerimyces flavus TaxID=1708749 RepID=A0ABV7Y212_9ACTN|nr:DUF72 domain-containing protein [Tenggerimyces flavus]MBM7790858.1 uncharacterized protein YecE (DUF72 family) [Tenggerimyces flavus]
MTIRVGISGWNYPPWRKVFYPEGLPQKRELEYASSKLSSIEINGSFYALQLPSSFERWYNETPDDFVFSLKGPRFITQMKKLADVDGPLANFFASGVLALKEKLGPILWQLPPTLGYDKDRLSAFFELLPRTTDAAVELAKQHEERMNDRAYLSTDEHRPIRHALEVRHSSYENEEFVDLLREHDIALVCADTAGKWPMVDDVTANDFVYVRLHGADQLYVSGYDNQALDRWAAKVTRWASGQTPTDGKTLSKDKAKRQPRDVFVYFDNDAKVRAPFDAMGLADRVGVGK